MIGCYWVLQGLKKAATGGNSSLVDLQSLTKPRNCSVVNLSDAYYLLCVPLDRKGVCIACIAAVSKFWQVLPNLRRAYITYSHQFFLR